MLAETAETVTVAVPAWLLAVVAFLGTLLGGAISFAPRTVYFADGQPKGYI